MLRIRLYSRIFVEAEQVRVVIYISPTYFQAVGDCNTPAGHVQILIKPLLQKTRFDCLFVCLMDSSRRFDQILLIMVAGGRELSSANLRGGAGAEVGLLVTFFLTNSLPRVG